MIIKNKLESIKKINELCLNKFPEQLFRSGEEIKVQEFLEKYPAKFYAIRDKSKACGIFKLKVSSENVLAEIKDYNLFTINVSSYNYVENPLVNTNIEIATVNAEKNSFKFFIKYLS